MAEHVQFRDKARALFAGIETEFTSLQARWSEDPVPQVDLEFAFDVQPGLIFPVVGTLQGDELCLSVGGSFFCEWFPCSDSEVRGNFQSCFRGVLSGQLRLVEFGPDGQAFKAQLQDHTSGRWQTVATWTKFRWPLFRDPEIRIFRNRPSLSNASGGLDRGLLADLRDEEIADPDAVAKACEAIHKEATHADLPWLRSLLADESALVREAGAWPIADLEGLPAIRDLMIAYQRGLDEGQDNDGFTALLIDMVSSNSGAAEQHLHLLTNDPNPGVRENARWLLDHCGAR